MDDAVGWLVAISFAFFSYRYFFSSSNGSGSNSARRHYAVPAQSIEAVSNMFPNIPRASIRYELERTRNNVQATVERCLSQGRLPDPPAGFFVDSDTTNPNNPTTPQRPTAASAAARAPITPASTGQGGSSTSATPSSSLIQRLQLQDRISTSPHSSPTSVLEDVKGKGKAIELGAGDVGLSPSGKIKIAPPVWETNAQAREKSLKERKERMVLEARRKLLERDEAKKAATGQ